MNSKQMLQQLASMPIKPLQIPKRLYIDAFKQWEEEGNEEMMYMCRYKYFIFFSTKQNHWCRINYNIHYHMESYLKKGNDPKIITNSEDLVPFVVNSKILKWV